MVKNIPAPCCGSYNVLILSKEDGDRMLYKAKCADCDFSASEWSETKQEAIYIFEQMCIATWKRNPSGLLNWMKVKPNDSKEKEKRLRIEKDVLKYVMGI